MSLHVTQFVNGRWRENCYLIADEHDNALIVDPGSQAEEIAALVDRNCWRVHAIMNTHGHYDHIGAVAPLKEHFHAPFYLHSADESLLKRANLYRMLFESREAIKVPPIDCDIAALPAVFEVGPFSISWMPTPGHTDGSVCFLIGNHLFSGDSLMHDALGRTDLPGGNQEQLRASVRKLIDLPGEMVLCGGHGPQSTLKAELSPGTRVWSLLQ
jgi:glyoxylase-like metal-dependent hydrolase (beta-lactamase superfamily II)